MTEDEDRRKFLASCGRFAAITTPAMTLLLSTTLTSNAIAQSGGRHGHGVSGGGSAGDYRGNTPISGGGGDYGAFGGGCGDHTPPTNDDELPAWIERMQKENPECTLDEILRSRPSATGLLTGLRVVT